MRYALILCLALSGCAMPRAEECDYVRPAFQAAAEYRMVRVGMNVKEVVCAWGRPNDINRTTYSGGYSEQWVYEKYYGEMLGSTWRFVYFEDGEVTAIQD